MADKETLPVGYLAWLESVEPAQEKFVSDGGIALQVLVDPREFSAWCHERRLPLDAKARLRFANYRAFRDTGAIEELLHPTPQIEYPDLRRRA